MPQLNRTSPGNNPDRKALGSKVVAGDRKGRRTAFIIASVVVVLILIIVGVSYYFSEDARYNRLTVITVDNLSIKMDYFLKRIKLADSDAMNMIMPLTNELLIKIAAPQYVGEVTPEDIDQELRSKASGDGETISEIEFKEWYRQQLNEIGLSDAEYRDRITTSILATRLQEYLAERVTTVAEQVHLHSVLVSTEDVNKIYEKENVVDKQLISEIWQAKQSEGTVEDLGWLPRGVLPIGFDETVFSLAIGDVSEPLAYTPPASDSTSTETETLYYLLMVSEKADNREIDEQPLQTLKATALDTWLAEEIELHEVGWHGRENGFDSVTAAWINYQLSKSNPSSTSQGQTQQ